MPALALASALIPAAYQGIQGIRQYKLAKKLKESTFIPPELLMNRDLAAQQAYSRRAPGQGFAEESIRRNTANQIGAANRSFGGDANKAAAVTSAATAQANDATARLAGQGAQFSEQAFSRMAGANIGIAQQKRQNRDEFNRTKAELIAAGDQNVFNALSNLGTAGVTHALDREQGRTGGARGPVSQGPNIPGSMKMNPWNTYLNGGFDPDALSQYDQMFRQRLGNPSYRPAFSSSYRRR